jgi:mannose-6-phosphate isomerase-like protein (cupin superfamily)
MTERTYFPRTPGKGIDVTQDDMKHRIARYKDLPEDPEAFVDHADKTRKRRITWAISPGQTGGPAPIDVPHGFHTLIITAGKGKLPPSHSHPYNEVFMCLEGRFAIFYGVESEAKAQRGEPDLVLEKFDMVSVPPGTMRTFACLDDEPGTLMTIFDTFGDPNIGVVVPPDLYEKYYKPTEKAAE